MSGFVLAAGNLLVVLFDQNRRRRCVTRTGMGSSVTL